MYLAIKRVFDLFFATLALVILFPFLLPIIILLRLTGEGKILYGQDRIGLNCIYFKIWKFATMLENSPNIGTGMITLRNDPRVTPMGGFLRKSKINELPQILNVLNGTMSIVGPRPTVRKHAEAYPESIRKQVYSSKPGITGLGSIVFRDEEELISSSKLEPFEFYKTVLCPYKAELEIFYLNNKSLLVDIKIIFLTAWVILFPKSDLVYKVFPGLPRRPF
jgi:lipopolysaccharide/colanic/teichoic acid biosynthesis glycosyltransferase